MFQWVHGSQTVVLQALEAGFFQGENVTLAESVAFCGRTILEEATGKNL